MDETYLKAKGQGVGAWMAKAVSSWHPVQG